MIRYRAAWVLPISRPPVRDGWVAVDAGRIVAYGGPNRLDSADSLAADIPRHASNPGVSDVDLGHVVLMPGLVNAHTHIELSYLHNQVPAGDDFVAWIRHIMAARRRRSDPSAPDILRAVNRAIDELVASGTALVGDISNTLVTFEPLAGSPLAAVVFNEVIRFKADDAKAVVEEAVGRLSALTPSDLVKPALAAHAPYSVAPTVFKALYEATTANAYGPCSVHLSESRAEVEFVGAGSGPWRSLLEEVGAWDASWTPPAASPVEYLAREGFLAPHVLAVHGVQMSPPDLARLRACGATLVTCPRSNLHTGAGIPPIQAFYESGVRIAVGTDSLASAPDLNVFSELAALRQMAPSVAASDLLDSATRQGAAALGFESEFGTLDPGRRARMVAVSIPRRTADVEEYLVSGIRPDQIRWIP